MTMRGGTSCRLLAGCCILLSTKILGAQQSERRRLEEIFHSAQAEYTSGHPAEAATQLESLLPKTSRQGPSQASGPEHLGPEYFPIEELLGLSYASMSQDARAVPYLEEAVRLKPEVEEAHTNLAASLMRLGRADKALVEFHKALALAPHDYTANHNLGEYLIQRDKLAEGVPYLEAANRIEPTNYDNGYDLAMAEMLTGQYAHARLVVQSLRAVKDTGELHNLEGQIDERDGKFIAAVNEFETAAHMDPSEENLFAWGSELMLHRTYEPAIDVFRAGAQRYPGSARIQIGLGITLYARGHFEEAVKALLTASDLSPSDPRCYRFLSWAYDSSPSQVDDVVERFRRYAERDPKNALAQYYYAMSLWKGKQAAGSAVDIQQVETLLTHSIALNGSIAESHFQLGNLYADQHQYERSVPEYVRAIELEPSLADAHYRLGTDYTHLGQKDRAQTEFAAYQKLRSEHMAEVDKQATEVQQFVYNSGASDVSKP